MEKQSVTLPATQGRWRVEFTDNPPKPVRVSYEMDVLTDEGKEGTISTGDVLADLAPAMISWLMEQALEIYLAQTDEVISQ